MRKMLLLLLFALGGVVLALTLGADEAGASVGLPLPKEQDSKPIAPVPDGDGITQTQQAENSNETAQSAESEARTKQVNVNAPIAVLSFGSNNGDVEQSNDATTKSSASNDNDTAQQVDQDQAASSSGSGGSVDQAQAGSNDNATQQEASSQAKTEQVNVNAPISVLSYGSNNGEVEQSNDAYTRSEASNDNATAQRVDQDQHAQARGDHCCGHGSSGGSGVDQEQAGQNSNETGQYASSEAKTEQTNVNLPVSVFSFGSNNAGGGQCGCDHGDGVKQDNDAYTGSDATNDNDTYQKVDQDQQASSWGVGGIAQSQSASNDNATEQRAESAAETEQFNVNAPIALASFGSDNGDVQQSNDASTRSSASNDNATRQGVDQDQHAQTRGDHCCKPDHGNPHKPDHHGKPCGCNHGGRSIDQQQWGENRNATRQEASSEAKTEQANVNVPISFLAFGANNGDVQQTNDADTTSSASNDNATGQWIGQRQHARSDGSFCDCKPKDHGTRHGHDKWDHGHLWGKDKWDHGKDSTDKRCGCEDSRISQRQWGANENHTEQSAYSKSKTEQKNVNIPFRFFTFDKDCGCVKHGHGDGVRQSNHAHTRSSASNENWTGQRIDQAQYALIER